MVFCEVKGAEEAVTVVVTAPEEVVAEDVEDTDELLLGVVQKSML